MHRSSYKAFSLVMVLALVLMALPMQSAQALSPDIVISQVYGGGGILAVSTQMILLSYSTVVRQPSL